MFTATFFGTTKVYTTRANAERALAFFIKNSNAHARGMPSNNWKRFSEAFQQENYRQALRVYNDYVHAYLWGNSLYIADVNEIEVDSKF